MLANLPPPLIRPAAPRDLRGFVAYLEDQGETGGCGTTSLGMVLSFWGGAPGLYDRRGLDRHVRRVDVGMTAGYLARHAAALGYRASVADAGSVDALRPWLAAGVPVMLLIENGPAPGAGRLHFVVALGLEPDPAGEAQAVRLADPKGGSIRLMPLAELDWRWRELRAGAIATGLDRVYSVFLPAQPTPVRGVDGQWRSTASLALPAPAAFDWRTALFERYLDLANAAGPASEAVGLRWWVW